MNDKIVFFDHTVDSHRYPNWKIWYYCDDNNYPQVVTYKTVSLDDLVGVGAGDGWLDVETEKGGFTCFGYMAPFPKFAKDHKLDDRETQHRQQMLENHYIRTKDYENFAHGIWNEVYINLRSLIKEQYIKWEFDQCVLSQLNLIKYRLLERKDLQYSDIFQTNGEGKHTHLSYKELSELNPSISSSIDDSGKATVSLNEDAKTLFGLVGFNVDAMLGTVL